jgi:hypothetical protein
MSTTPPPERGRGERGHDEPGDERLQDAKRRYDEVASSTGARGRDTGTAGRQDRHDEGGERRHGLAGAFGRGGRRHDDDRHDRHDDRHDRHDDRHERHDDRHERHDDRHGRHADGRHDDRDVRPAAAYRKPRRGFHQWLALLVGVAYLVVGLWGFGVTGLAEPANPEWWTRHDESWMLLVFAINPLHNVVHLVVGLLGVMLWPSSGGARTYGWLLALGFIAVFLYGLVAQGNEQLDVLHLNWPDNWLHLGTAILGLIIALWPRKKRRANEAAYDDARAR